LFRFNGQPFSPGRPDASAKSAALDALAAGFLHDVLQSAALVERPSVSGAISEFFGTKGDYLLGLSRYVHLNPVRGPRLGRGSPTERRKRLRGFKWSSYRGYAGLSAPFPFLEEAMVLDELRGPKRAERLHYRRFVEESLLKEIENPFEAVQWQAVLGDESFVQKLRDRVKGLHQQRREITSLRRAMPSIDPERVLERVARKYQVDRKRLIARGERGAVRKECSDVDDLGDGN